MGIFSRINRLVKSNVNDMLDKVTDPGKEIEQIILDMNIELKRAKSDLLAALAEVKKVEKRAEAVEQDILMWQGRAEKAVASGDDELAKAALMKKNETSQLLEGIQVQVAEERARAETVKQAHRDLEKRLMDITARKESLKARAVASKRNRENEGGVGTFSEFDRLASRIDALTAEAESDVMTQDVKDATTAAKFAALDKAAPEGDDALAELKRKMNEEAAKK